jgi:hypothetical protein
MGAAALTSEMSKGVKTIILVMMLVLLLFVIIMVAGRPIMYFETEPASIAYAVAVYTPVMAICILAYRRLR